MKLLDALDPFLGKPTIELDQEAADQRTILVEVERALTSGVKSIGVQRPTKSCVRRVGIHGMAARYANVTAAGNVEISQGAHFALGAAMTPSEAERLGKLLLLAADQAKRYLETRKSTAEIERALAAPKRAVRKPRQRSSEPFALDGSALVP